MAQEKLEKEIIEKRKGVLGKIEEQNESKLDQEYIEKNSKSLNDPNNNILRNTGQGGQSYPET